MVPESTYVLAVAVIATWGFTTESTVSILLAVLLALPTGAPALIGYYMAYGLLAQVPGANPSSSSGSAGCSADGVCHESSTGDAAVWLTHTTELLGILALTAAAVLNLVFLRILVARRRVPNSSSCEEGCPFRPDVLTLSRQSRPLDRVRPNRFKH